MSLQDPIADMLTRVRNALAVRKTEVTMPQSKLKIAIAQVLKDEGYILDYRQSADEEGHKLLVIKLKYHLDQPVIEELVSVSKPSMRVYKNKNDLPKVKNGLGVAIVSTSKGVMSDRTARSNGQGGEIICYVS